MHGIKRNEGDTHECRLNWMTSHQMLKMAAALHLTHPNPTLQVARLLPQTLSPSFSDLQSDVFQGFYSVRFVPVHYLLQVNRKK